MMVKYSGNTVLDTVDESNSCALTGLLVGQMAGGQEFVFSAGEQEFYAERGFQNEPQRCKACRDARKNAARGPREFFTAVCAACGGEAKVPFEPKSDRPVYCSECFAKMKEQA